MRQLLSRLALTAGCGAAMVGAGALAFDAAPASGQTALTTPTTISSPTVPATTTPVTQPPVTQPPVTRPPVTRPPATVPPTTKPPVTAPPTTPVATVPTTLYRPPVAPPPSNVTVPSTTTTTTLAPIKGQVPSAPATLPLITRGSNAHVDPVLAKVSLGGLALALLILLVQFVLTRPGREGRRTL